MGNLIAEENGEAQSHVELKQHFLINLILTEIQTKCHKALAITPARIAIRLLDGDRTANSPLQLALVLARTSYMQYKLRSDETIIQQIANLSFGISARCHANLPLSSLFPP
ncbi:hypothetical protein AVEN_232053-1 [Araneus ventricosus]|uniref:Uncharacterized protein n=1 Tax=Araneus ventricosus TaxID=182803 RepID=A0A4Y2EIH3_ARAVE|nr:hypothetical protein AVEN_232053-1 [Araneus ventricosus]